MKPSNLEISSRLPVVRLCRCAAWSNDRSSKAPFLGSGLFSGVISMTMRSYRPRKKASHVCLQLAYRTRVEPGAIGVSVAHAHESAPGAASTELQATGDARKLLFSRVGRVQPLQGKRAFGRSGAVATFQERSLLTVAAGGAPLPRASAAN